jgi:SAM-dependent methyltransferase
MTNKIYLKDKKCLAFINEKATSDFWDRFWESDELEKFIRRSESNMYTDMALKYLPKGARILEGGCGRGQVVHSLKFQGYDSVGIDFAAKTVKAVNDAVPELDVVVGDVFDLPFGDDEFDGYVSVGVIEHFWDGYDKILSEMARVIKPGGYLFLTAPAMSLLRRTKARLGLYPKNVSENIDSELFYQFAVNVKQLKKDLRKYDFEIEEQSLYDAVKGIKDEVSLFRKTLQQVYDRDFPHSRRISRILNIVFSRFTGHCVCLVLKKK